MNITKYKLKKKNLYEVTIDNEKYDIYEDVIIKHKLLLKHNITKQDLDKYLNENKFYEAYYNSIKFISIKMRSKKELKDYLTKKEYNKELINEVTNKITNEGYLDERKYAKAYILDCINLKNDGPIKIKKELLKHEIDSNIIDDELTIFKIEIINNKINKYIDKEIKTNKTKSSKILKEKILNNLILKGYSREDILRNLSTKEIDDKQIYENEYNKINNKLSKKYESKELELKIKQKMYQKGFYK